MKLQGFPGMKKLLLTATLGVALSSCVEERNKDVCACLERGEIVQGTITQHEQRELATRHRMTGQASYYHESLNGELTYNEQVYNENLLTAAHMTLVQNKRHSTTKACVKAIFELEDGSRVERTVLVDINDKGPHKGGELHPTRVIDLSKQAFRKLLEGLPPVKNKKGVFVPATPEDLGIIPHVEIRVVSIDE